MRGKVVALHEALRTAGLPHAFGGALALAYYAEPRPTADIDLNVFVPESGSRRVRAALAPLGVEAAPDPAGGAALRLRWQRQRVHVFLSTDPLHEAMDGAVRELPCNGTVVPIVAPEHLVVRKAMLDREKDWTDIKAILATTDPFDHAEVESWMQRLGGRSDPRAAKFRELANR